MISRLLRLARPISVFLFAASAAADWLVYLGDGASSQYSELSQITVENVSRLELAWTYASGGGSPENRSQIQCNPLVIDGVLYGTSADLVLFAVDAATGEERWRFDPRSVAGVSVSGVNRGLVAWRDGERLRIAYGNDAWLHLIDAASGRRVESFGEQGTISLREGLGRDASGLSIQANTPGIVFRDLLILGTRVGEGPAPAAPGHIRAFDLKSGEQVWMFRTIPHPGEEGHETWPPEAWRRAGGANVWAGFALDEERGLVFCPTGSPSYDFWGGDRLGENVFGNCLIALDAATGERRWHRQLVRHDLWDRDLPAPPNLFTLRREGREIPAVAQITKSGHVFVFHRETGEPLFPLEEVATPPSDLAGESAWPSQPLPLLPPPFARQLFTWREITDLSEESHRAVLDRFVTLRPHVPFMPPSREGTILFPGFDGGAEWGGAAADPDGILYVNSNEMPWIMTMVEVDTAATGGGELVYTRYCAACHGIDREGVASQNVPSLDDLSSRMDGDGFRELLRTGKGVMPSFAFLHEDDVAGLASYLLGEAEPPAGEPRELEQFAGQPAADVPYTMSGYHRWLDPDGYPAVKPPWGTLNAIDLNAGEIRWSVPLGEYPELVARGLPPTGTENYGGPVVTAGNLLFIASTRDEMIRAFDRRDGREMWRHPLPAAGYATPAVYQVAGVQYVVIACGGGKIGTSSGDRYLAFRLPAEE